MICQIALHVSARLAQNPFKGKAGAFSDGTAPCVGSITSDFQALGFEHIFGKDYERVYGLGCISLPHETGVEPISHFELGNRPVYGMEAALSHQLARSLLMPLKVQELP